MYEKNDSRKTYAGRYVISSTDCNGTAAGSTDHTAKGSKSSIGNSAKSPACPVNVEIYDAAGKMVERVYDGKESEGYTGDIYYNVFYNPVADDYVKIIRLPADEGYSLKCEATDTGSVDYYFSAFDKDGNVVQKEIENIPVETGNSVQIPDTSGNRTECILKKGDDIEKEYIAQTVSEEYVAVMGISCKNLKTIRIASTSLTKKSVGKNAFKGIHKKAVIKLPKKNLKAYQKFLKGKGQAKSVKIKK